MLLRRCVGGAFSFSERGVLVKYCGVCCSLLRHLVASSGTVLVRSLFRSSWAFALLRLKIKFNVFVFAATKEKATSPAAERSPTTGMKEMSAGSTLLSNGGFLVRF